MNTNIPNGVRAAFFSDSLPERNGTGAYYFDLLGQLQDKIEAVRMFQPLHRDSFSRFALPMPGDPSQKLITPNLFRIRRELNKFNANIIISITPGPFGLLGLYYAWRNKIPFLSAFHTDFESLMEIYWRPAMQAVAGTYLRTVNTILCRRSRSVLVMNEKLIPQVLKLGASETDIMGTPLHLDILESSRSPLPEKIDRICFAGRLAEEKNVDQIIEAAKIHRQIVFTIVGDGPLRGKLEESAKSVDNLHFTGWLSRQKLIEIMDANSLLLLPSKFETFGSVALEAMARGRLALVSENAGIHHWPELREGFYSLKSGTKLCDRIGELLKIPMEEHIRKAKSARKAAESLNRRTIGHWLDVLVKYTDMAGTQKIV